MKFIPGFLNRALILLLITWVLFCSSAQADTPTGIWATVYGGSLDDAIWELRPSPEGVIYSVGFFDYSFANHAYGSGIVKFDRAGKRVGSLPMLTAPGQTNVQLHPNSIRFDSEGNFVVSGSGYLAKYNMKDQLLWRKDLAVDAWSYLKAAIDRDGSIIFTGSFKGPGKLDGVTFGDGGGPVIGRVSSDGTLQWVRRIQESGKQSGAGSVELDREGNIFVAGYLSGGETDFGGQILYPDWLDGFIAKYTPDGDLIWVQVGYRIDCGGLER